MTAVESGATHAAWCPGDHPDQSYCEVRAEAIQTSWHGDDETAQVLGVYDTLCNDSQLPTGRLVWKGEEASLFLELEEARALIAAMNSMLLTLEGER